MQKDYWWSESGLRFECLGCGRCCGGEPGLVRFSSAERAAAAKELGISGDELCGRYLVRKFGIWSVREVENFDCIFLERNSLKCKIYKARPLQCRLFPFWPSMLKDQNCWNYYANICHGMNHGRFFEPYLLMKFLNLPQAQDL